MKKNKNQNAEMRSAHNLALFPVRLLCPLSIQHAVTPTLQSVPSVTELITAITAHQPALMSLSPQRAVESRRDVTLPQIHTHSGQGLTGCVLKLSIISCFPAIGWLNITSGWKTVYSIQSCRVKSDTRPVGSTSRVRGSYSAKYEKLTEVDGCW